jgi:uncharacterized protein (TIGR04206 family)
MWVRSEYANELAVLAAWLAVFVPWSGASHTQRGTVLGGEVTGDILFLRFPFVELQFRDPGVIESGEELIEVSEPLDAAYSGVELVGNVYVTTPPSSLLFYESTLWQASLLWTVASVGFALAFLLSLALYVREDRVVAVLPVSSVRLMGALLGVGALGTAGASILHYTARDTVGVPIPAGVLVIAVLAAVLLRTEEVERPDDAVADAESADPDA